MKKYFAAVIGFLAVLAVFFYAISDRRSQTVEMEIVEDPNVLFQTFKAIRSDLTPYKAYRLGDVYIIISESKGNEVSSNTGTVVSITKSGEQILAEHACDTPLTPGFSGSILRYKNLAVVFGKIGGHITVLSGDSLVKVPFDEIELKVIYTNDVETSYFFQCNDYYVINVDSNTTVKDIQYIIDGKVMACYSDYYGNIE